MGAAALLVAGVLVFFMVKQNQAEDLPPPEPSKDDMRRAGDVRTGSSVEREQGDAIISGGTKNQ
jgi:hypothetical protein